jgi:hypothetical protein
MNGTSYDTGPKSMAGESGALDNVLTLNPNDPRWPAVLEWKDDATYTFTNVKVRQVSPGQFEVVSAEVGEDKEMPAEDEAAQRAEDKAPPKGSYSNPAIENLQM